MKFTDYTYPEAVKASLTKNPETGKNISPAMFKAWRQDESVIPEWAKTKLETYDKQMKEVHTADFSRNQAEHLAQFNPAEGCVDPKLWNRERDPGFCEISDKWSNVDGWGESKMCIGLPTTGHSTHTKTIYCLMALQALHTKKVSFIPCENNPVGRARNIIATQFLHRPEKPAWLLLIDSDMIVPFGSGPWAEEIWKKFGGLPANFAKLDICSRLASHGKQLVGALYVGRGPNGNAQFAEAYENIGVNRLAHAGPKDELKPTKWVATGAMLIHRDVFVKIAEKFPDLRPRHADDPYRFFAMEDDEGEDMLFCKRAREAGIQPYVDLGCHCGHEGQYIFWPHNTTAIAPKPGEFLDAKSIIAANAVKVEAPVGPTRNTPPPAAAVASPDQVQAQRANPMHYVSPPIAPGVAAMAAPMPDVSKPPVSHATTQIGAQPAAPNAPAPANIHPANRPSIPGTYAPPAPGGLLFGGGAELPAQSPAALRG